MTDQEQAYEDDFAVVDKKEYEKTKGKNLYEDLENYGFISEEDYEKASDQEKKAYDELKNILKDA